MSTAASRAAEKVEAAIRERYGMEIDVHFGPTTPYSVSAVRVRICRRCASLVASVEEHDAWHRAVDAEVVSRQSWPPRPDTPECVQWGPGLKAQAMGVSPLVEAAETALQKSAGITEFLRRAVDAATEAYIFSPDPTPCLDILPTEDSRFKVGDLVQHADFQPMKVAGVHDSHGLYYETVWSENGEFAGNYVHEDLRAVDGSGLGEVGSRA